jgi:hypothetical protein
MAARRTILTAMTVAILAASAIASTTQPAADRSAANMRQIAAYLQTYINENNGRLPQDLTYLQKLGHLKVDRKVFLPPDAKDSQVKIIEDMPDDDFNEWLLRSSHYLYVSYGNTKIKYLVDEAAKSPVLIERGRDQPIRILYLDWSIRTLSPDKKE